MAKAKKGKPTKKFYSKEIEKLEQEIIYDVEIVENIQKKSLISKDDLDLIEVLNKKIQQATEKLQTLKGFTDNLIETNDEYESTLRSIGSRYGEINDVYKESEKILNATKNEISAILSISGKLNISNKTILDGVLKSQKAYGGITASIVENMGSLEDSESSYKKIGIQIDEQKKLVQSLAKELESIDKSDEEQIKAAEILKKQLKEQTSSLDGMKNAAKNVEAKLKSVSKAASVLGQTPVGSFINEMLAGVQQIGRAFGAELPGSIEDLLEGSKKSIGKGGLSKLKKIEGESQVPPPTQTESVEQTTPIADSIKDSTTPIADSIKDSAKPVADSIKDAATPVADSIKDSAKPVADSIKDSATPVADSIKDATTPVQVPEPKKQTIDEIAESMQQPKITPTESIQQSATPVETAEPKKQTIDEIAQSMEQPNRIPTELMQQQGRTPNESIQQSVTPIEPPEIKLPGQIETKISTEPLEKEQTVQAKKNTNLLSNLNRVGQRAARKPSKKAELTAGQIKQDEPKIPQPDQTSIDNSKETNNVTNVTNVGDAATPTVESGTKPLQDVAESIASPVSQELKTEATDYSDKIKNSGTDAMGSIASAGESVIKGAELAGAAGGGGALAAAGPYVAAAAGIYMLGQAVIDATRYFDSLEDATDTLARSMYGASQLGYEEDVAREAIGDFSNPIGQFGGEDVRDEVMNTKEYRQLVFDFSVGQAVKQRQELAQDYFNFEKQNYMDLVGYQQSLTTDAIDYEIGLQRDAINFRFQQESANLDAELEKRKTLAGSAMKFIGNYAKVSERALNAIGSSTKAIMDGMKQFGAILGGTTKQQFSLIENAQGLSYSYGASADQVLNISHMFKLLGNTTENAGMRLVEGIKGFVGPTGNVQAVFNEIVEASADIYRLMSATPNEIAKQTVALQKAGVKLSSMLKASDTMVLNYKDSIKAEMSLGAMIGRNVSFNEARARLMSGDMVGAANAIRQSLGGIDVNQLNPFAKQELTKATGLQLDQIIQLQQTGKIETEGDKQLKQAKLTGKAIADAVLSQDIANAGARLALEQKQRKEMLEFEQRVRLLNLSVEQAKRLQMIPIEAAYRAKYAQDIQFKQDVDNMVLGVIREGITGTFSKLNAEQYTQIGNEMMGAYGLQTNPAAVGGQTMITGIAQLQATLTNLNTNIPSLVSVTDPKYAKYMSSQFKMGEEYRSEVSKKGISDEEKNKIAEKYKSMSIQLYESSFAQELEIQRKNNQDIQNKKAELNAQLKKQMESDIDSLFSELDKGIFQNVDEGVIFNTIKNQKTQQDLEKFFQRYKEKTGKDLVGANLTGFSSSDGSEELTKHLKKMGYYLGGSDDYGFSIQKSSDYKKIEPTSNNTVTEIASPGGTFPTVTTSGGTVFQQGPIGNGTYTPPGGQSFPTGFNTYTPPTTTPPPGGETISNEKDITNQIEVVKVLNKIQSEAHSRGITMHTEQKTTTAYIKSSAEKLHYAKVAVEGTKMDSTKLVEKGIPSTQNLEQISIEMIKELQVANELLAGVFNNTQPAEGGIVLNLDGKKLATNFQNRMNNRQAFNNANRTRTNP